MACIYSDSTHNLWLGLRLRSDCGFLKESTVWVSLHLQAIIPNQIGFMVSLDRYPCLQNVYRSVYIPIVRHAAPWTCPISIRERDRFIFMLADMAGFCSRCPLSCFGKHFTIFGTRPFVDSSAVLLSVSTCWYVSKCEKAKHIYHRYDNNVSATIRGGHAHYANRLSNCQAGLYSTGDRTHVHTFSLSDLTFNIVFYQRSFIKGLWKT